MRKLMVLVIGLAGLCVATGCLAADGKKVYDETCAGCHAGMSPKTGDKAAWTPRIKKGAAALTASVMRGKGAMPPKGGAASQAQVKAAVDYMIEQSK